MEKKIVGKFENNDTFVCYKPQNFGGMDLVVYECGYEKCDPKHFWGPNKKDYYVLHYSLSGKGKITINKSSYTVESNDGFFLSPEDVTHYVADEEEPWEYIWVYFGGTTVKSILDKMAISSKSPIFHDPKREIQTVFQNLYQASLSKTETNLSALGYLYLLFAELIKLYPSQKKEKHGDEFFFFEALRIIQREFERNINIERLAKKMGFSRSHLYRIFIENTGIGPKEYIMRLRIAYACEMIKEGKKSLGDISFILGFSDYKAFSKTFMRIIGTMPGEFLERLAADSFIYDKNMELLRFIEQGQLYQKIF